MVVDRTDVVLRSTDFPKMKFNQFLMAPYFGPGLLPHVPSIGKQVSAFPHSDSEDHVTGAFLGSPDAFLKKRSPFRSRPVVNRLSHDRIGQHHDQSMSRGIEVDPLFALPRGRQAIPAIRRKEHR